MNEASIIHRSSIYSSCSIIHSPQSTIHNPEFGPDIQCRTIDNRQVYASLRGYAKPPLLLSLSAFVDPLETSKTPRAPTPKSPPRATDIPARHESGVRASDVYSRLFSSATELVQTPVGPCGAKRVRGALTPVDIYGNELLCRVKQV